MNAGLKYLLWRETLGAFRVARRRFRGIQGVVAVVGIGVFLAAILGPRLAELARSEQDPDILRQRLEAVRFWAPPGLLAALVTFGFTTATLYFKPAEIDFLFPAPVSRRQLIAFNVLSRLRVGLLSALWCSLFCLGWSASWTGAFVGSFFLFALLQLSAQLSGLLLSTASEALGRRLRRLAGLLLVIALLSAALFLRPTHDDFAGLFAGVRELAGHPAVRVASWVTTPFVELFLGASLADILGWSGACLGVLLIELAVIFGVDVKFAERSIATGQRVQTRLQQLRSEGGALTSTSASSRWRLPSFPRLGGAGVVAWRQSLEIIRHAKSLIVLFLFGCLPIVPFLATSRSDGSRVPTETAFPLLVLVTVFFSQNATFDFRRDLDRMVLFKSLPLGGSSVAAGQILPLATLVTLVQAASLAVIAYAQQGIEPWVLATLALALPPLNWIVVAIDNTVFLLFPHRVEPQDAGNMPFVGRMMMVMTLKMLVVAAIVGVGAGLGAFAWWISGESLVVAGAVATIYLSTLTVPATQAVAFAFERFDVSRSN